MAGDDEQKRSWRAAFDNAKRSASGQHVAAQPPPSNSDVVELLELVKVLGEDVMRLIPEFRGLRRTVRLGVAACAVLLVGFVYGAHVQNQIHVEQRQARKADRRALSRAIDKARRDLSREAAKAHAASRRAAKAAEQAARESLAAQIEAAEVQKRITPPRKRDEVEKRITTKRKMLEAMR